VDNEMKALQIERVDGGYGVLAEPRPAVVEVLRAVGEPHAGQVEGDTAQVAGRKLVEHPSVQEGRRRDALHAEDRLAVSGLPDEAGQAGGGERAARGT